MLDDTQGAHIIRILIVEDDADWIRSITTLLHQQPDLLVVGAATNAEEAIKLSASIEYDIVLMDVLLSEGSENGIYTALELRSIRPQSRVIMLTSQNDERTMTDAFTAGASYYLDKTRFRELASTIRSVYYHPEAMDALLKELSRLKREEQLQGLTAAEREVFELMEQGHTHAQIEKKLFKAESTLKNQINKMLKKLGVRSSKEAIEKVRRNGLR
ncbi:response regulator [Paenibacillus xylaniclasticus]|uniref:response regulator n=1 Tax=Paenibacillus xylaniclasticus TaxID=588083 RepID=UPI000FD7F9C2|nr:MULTISPECIES: response regulator transcription factor [Paenibacillus]GFN31744.1 DNA-binding response regulator [Paenibacillus curdlanolyticus]